LKDNATREKSMIAVTDCVCSVQREMPDGSWKPAKPVSGPFIWELKSRIKAAWLVLRGQATAVRWY